MRSCSGSGEFEVRVIVAQVRARIQEAGGDGPKCRLRLTLTLKKMGDVEILNEGKGVFGLGMCSINIGGGDTLSVVGCCGWKWMIGWKVPLQGGMGQQRLKAVPLVEHEQKGRSVVPA